MVVFEDIPTDIIHHIFLCLPDFSTLSTLLRTSKRHFYDVFEENRTTIIAAIPWNTVGPALPSAARVLFCEDSTEFSEADILNPEYHEYGRDEYHELEKNAAIVAQYEDLFSIRYLSSYLDCDAKILTFY